MLAHRKLESTFKLHEFLIRSAKSLILRANFWSITELASTRPTFDRTYRRPGYLLKLGRTGISMRITVRFGDAQAKPCLQCKMKPHEFY
jgi:hypothetical protein